MSNEIEVMEIGGCKLELSKMFISDTKKVEFFAKELETLGKIVLDLSTKDKIKEAKGLRTQANKFVEKLKEFCEPLEAEGQRIKDARSLISTKLNKSKSSVIEALLAPVDEREEKIKSIENKLFIPSSDANSNSFKIAEVEGLKNYNWLGFEEEALSLIEQHKQFLLNEKIKFDAEAKAALEAAEKAKLAREEEIRVAAEARAKAEAQKAIDEANARAAKAEEEKKNLEQINKNFGTPNAVVIEQVPKASVGSSGGVNKTHQAKIHNEILADFLNVFEKMTEEQVKEAIKLIAMGKIRNLKIVY